jgi:hypothetical protein
MLGSPLILSTNNRQGWIGLPGTDTYYQHLHSIQFCAKALFFDGILGSSL